MVNNTSTLFVLLDRYSRGDLTLEALQDQISLGLQEYFDKASEEDIEILSEIQSAIYEAEDGLLEEEEFRRAIKELIKAQATSSLITVGQPPPRTYYPYIVKTSASSADLSVFLKAA